MKKFLLPLMALVLLSGAGCSRQTDNEAAVRRAIEKYLASRPNLNISGMDLQVSAIKFRGDTAEADVTFRSKTDTQATFAMHYTLRRRQRVWEVEPPSGGHGGVPPAAPPGHGSAAGDLPSGHPPVGSSPPAPEPPSRPPVKSK